MPERLRNDNPRFESDPSEEVWVRGVIEVEFRDSADAGLSIANLSERTEYSEAWSPGLREILQAGGLIKWGPSFPLSYPWTKDTSEALREFYVRSGRDRFVTFHFPQDTALVSLSDQLEQQPLILRAAPVPHLRPPAGPLDDPLVGNTDQVTTVGGGLENQWYLFRCRVHKAWAKSTGAGVVVADIDWGFSLFHNDLNNNRVTLARNTIENSTVVSNGNLIKHGTAALALAGAKVNGLGIAGVAFDSELWAIQAGDDSVSDHKFWVSAIDFVRSTNSEFRKVIMLELQTNKLGNVEMCHTINKAIVDAISDHVVVCVPAGNGGIDAGIGHDGKAIPPTGSVLVGATRYESACNIRDFSNTGSRIVVYAPGDASHDMTCGVSGADDYTRWFGGTSGAVAKVGGVVALMLSINKNLSQEDICEILKRSELAVLDYSLKAVGVLVNAEQAVCEALKRKGNVH